MHHSIVMDRKSRNLDTWMFPEAVEDLFLRGSVGADISVIEGVMGFYDGLDGRSELGSTAHLSKVLKAPTILVLDACSSARSAGAVALGFAEYDKGVNIAGVIFNNVAGRQHLEMLESSLRGMESLGGIPREEGVELRSRHLGLVPAAEDFDAFRYEKIREVIESSLDMDKLIAMARSAPPIGPESLPAERKVEPKTKIGVAMDMAFNFYYEDSLQILRNLGAEIVPFSPLKDELPEVEGLYFGGGYPEVFASGLEDNQGLRKRIKAASYEGMPIYAECGGMMYLCRSLIDLDSRGHEMVGIFDCDVAMTKGLQALGYVEAEVVHDNLLAPRGRSTRGHVFHYSHVVDPQDDGYAYRLNRGKGIKGTGDGLIFDNTLSSYTHLHFASCPDFAQNFVDACVKFGRR
jgi:cobyrinic acid a,c-diamide synthase